MMPLELYRYTDARSPYDGWPSKICLTRYPIVGETEASWKIQLYPGTQAPELRSITKWVLKGCGKRFAHERLDWAAYSWRRRQQTRLRHLQNQLEHVERILKADPRSLPLPDPSIEAWRIAIGDLQSGENETSVEVHLPADNDQVIFTRSTLP